MKRISLLIFIVLVLFSSCNNKKQKREEVIEKSQMSDNFVKEGIKNTDVFYRKGTINTDCNYYIENEKGDWLIAGSLTKGQRVVILKKFSLRAREEDGIFFDVSVKIRTEDDLITGYVYERYILYDNELYTAWFKNVLLTRDYYYKETVDYIYEKHFSQFDEEYNEGAGIIMMGETFSEHKMLITENLFVIGNDHGDIVYKLISIKKEENKYLLRLLYPLNNEEFEIFLLDYGNSIAIIGFIAKDKAFEFYNLEDFINTKYIKYDAKKSEILRNKIYSWVKSQKPDWTKGKYKYGY